MASKGGDYGWYRATFQDKTTQNTLATADTATVAVVTAPRVTANALFIQRITLAVYTDAAQTLTFQDNNGSPVVIAKSPSSPGLGLEVVADFGPAGKQLTAGKELDMVISGAGIGAIVSVEAYEKQVTTATAASS